MAAALRSRRDLRGELNWHLAAAAAYQETRAIIERLVGSAHLPAGPLGNFADHQSNENSKNNAANFPHELAPFRPARRLIHPGFLFLDLRHSLRPALAW